MPSRTVAGQCVLSPPAAILAVIYVAYEAHGNMCYHCYVSADFGIAEVGDGLTVRGVSRSDLTEALDLLNALRALRADPSGWDLVETALPRRIAGGRYRYVVNAGELAEAFKLLNAIRTLQAEHVDATRDELLRALMIGNISLTPNASLNQTQHLATHRNALLAAPSHTYESLRALRADKQESTTRTWVARRRDGHELFTVTYNGRTLIPGFQFDEQGKLRPELQPMLAALDEGGVRDWSLWTWLTQPTSFLSGEIPEQIARTDPTRGLRAARRFAAPPVA